MTHTSAYHFIIDRIPRQFREAGKALHVALVNHAVETGFAAQLFGTPELQRAAEDWHAAIAAARAWSALQGAKGLHRQTTTRHPQFAADRSVPLTVGTFFSLPFDEALRAFYDRHADILIDVGDLWELYWERGATVAEASAAEMRAGVLRSLGAAMEAGTPMREWKAKAVGEFGGSEAYYEAVYRTNVAQAYSDGQRAQASNYPDVIGFRRLTTRDQATRPNHRAAHGRIWRKDDPRADMLAAPWG